MTNRKQYVTINGKKLYINQWGNAELNGEPALTREQFKVLGLEIETEAPPFEDIEPGIYSPHGEEGNTIFRKLKSGTWVNAQHEAVSEMQLAVIADWHELGFLYRFNKGEATNA